VRVWSQTSLISARPLVSRRPHTTRVSVHVSRLLKDYRPPLIAVFRHAVAQRLSGPRLFKSLRVVTQISRSKCLKRLFPRNILGLQKPDDIRRHFKGLPGPFPPAFFHHSNPGGCRSRTPRSLPLRFIRRSNAIDDWIRGRLDQIRFSTEFNTF
jgi:hypothetical protein